MAEKRIGTLVYRENLSSVLSIFRVTPERGHRFPEYQAGTYIALRRENCMLTKKVTGPKGQVSYVPDMDNQGTPKRGPVTHSYSIASAPFETVQNRCLEFYIILEKSGNETPGRLTESLFRMEPGGDNQLTYVDRIVGDFTLEKRAAGFRSVLMVGTGTGLAPFASMVKQLAFDASRQRTNGAKYTLIHANRTFGELGYHRQLSSIESSQLFDFVYVPSVSRPTMRDLSDPKSGKGRANNLLRSIFEMPPKEEENLLGANTAGEGMAHAKEALRRAVSPVLPRHITRRELQARLNPSETVILTCGNPVSMADIKRIAVVNGIHFEKEDW